MKVDGTEVNWPQPMLSVAWCCVTAACGMSAATMVRKVGVAAAPVVGPAKNVFAV